jgi:CRP-like cAMP-binding protein
MTPNDLRERAALLGDLPDYELDLLLPAVSEKTFAAHALLFREDQPADEFFIVESGLVALELGTGRREPITLLTVGPSELVGVSWMFPPYRWALTARALQETQVLSFDAVELRQRCEEDAGLRLWITQMVAAEATKRLQATRVQLLDLYDSPQK